jgi:hypothetical protein
MIIAEPPCFRRNSASACARSPWTDTDVMRMSMAAAGDLQWRLEWPRSPEKGESVVRWPRCSGPRREQNFVNRLAPVIVPASPRTTEQAGRQSNRRERFAQRVGSIFGTRIEDSWRPAHRCWLRARVHRKCERRSARPRQNTSKKQKKGGPAIDLVVEPTVARRVRGRPRVNPVASSVSRKRNRYESSCVNETFDPSHGVIDASL